jgi:hypothetical protein
LSSIRCEFMAQHPTLYLMVGLPGAG